MLYLLACAAVICLANADEIPSARVFLQKSTFTDPVVESKEFEVSYLLINNGEIAASQVEVTDRYDPDSFEVLGAASDDGSVSFEVDSIAPGGQYRHNVTVVPKLSGMYESTRARFRYFSEDPDDEDADANERQGSSSSMGKIKIISMAEYEKAMSHNVKEWVVCIVLVLVAVVVPFSNMKTAKADVALLSKSK